MALAENPDPRLLIQFLVELHGKLYTMDEIYKQEYGFSCKELPPLQEAIEELVADIKRPLIS